MYKNRNTGRGTECRGTRGMGGMLYSEECRQTFQGMLPKILGNVLKHSKECRQTFRGMSLNIPGNVLKHSGECRQTFQGMSSNIPGNVAKDSGECRKTFWRMSPNILGNMLQIFFMLQEIVFFYCFGCILSDINVLQFVSFGKGTRYPFYNLIYVPFI